jgi:hypothetical protein
MWRGCVSAVYRWGGSTIGSLEVGEATSSLVLGDATATGDERASDSYSREAAVFVSDRERQRRTSVSSAGTLTSRLVECRKSRSAFVMRKTEGG